MAKTPKLIRPEIQIEYVGIIGFLCAVCAIVRAGIRKVVFEICGNKIGESYIIPKYSIKATHKKLQ